MRMRMRIEDEDEDEDTLAQCGHVYIVGAQVC